MVHNIKISVITFDDIRSQKPKIVHGHLMICTYTLVEISHAVVAYHNGIAQLNKIINNDLNMLSKVTFFESLR